VSEAEDKTSTYISSSKRRTTAKRTPQLAGEVTYIPVPTPQASSFNKNRPVSSLLLAQMEHIRHAESARLPKHKRGVGLPIEIRTEADAATYIAAITRMLHPQRKKRAKSRPPSQGE
jgi:hypothetical protein